MVRATLAPRLPRAASVTRQQPGGPAEPSSSRGGPTPIPCPLPTPVPCLLAPSPRTHPTEPIFHLVLCPSAHPLHCCLLEGFLQKVFFHLSDYILKGNLTAPLEMENKHCRQQMEGIRTNRMATKHVLKSHEAWDPLKAGHSQSSSSSTQSWEGHGSRSLLDDIPIVDSSTYGEGTPTQESESSSFLQCIN